MQQVVKIFSWGNIGDALLLTPCLRALKKQHPEVVLHLYYKNADHRDVFLHNPFANILADRATASPVPLGYERVYEPAIGFHWPNTLYKVNASRVLAEVLDVTLEDDRPELFLTAEETQAARQTMERFRRPVVAIHPSSSFDYKEWYPERWAELIQRNASWCTFVQMGVAADQRIDGTFDLRGRSLREAFAILGQCDAMVGVDSALAHAAPAVGTPGIVLFGASSPLVFGHKENVNLCAQVACSPCLDFLHYGRCPLGRVCMQAISVDAVDKALNALLEPKKRAAHKTPSDARHEERDLLAARFLLSDEFALTFDWEGEPTLYSFRSPERHVRVSEAVRVLLACFPASEPVSVGEALESFGRFYGTERTRSAMAGILAAVRELAGFGVLVPARTQRSRYSEEMARHYIRSREIPAEISSTIAAAAAVSAGTAILDIGTGTGSIAIGLAEDSDDVTALDVSAPFLEAARAAAAARGVRPVFRNACANKLVLDDAEYDVLVISQAFHWLDASCAVRGAYHALKPGGLLYILETKPMLPASHPLKALLGHGCPSREFVEWECGRHAEWYANLFEALKPHDSLIAFERTWVFHQRRPFDSGYARAFFFVEDLKSPTLGQSEPWEAIEQAFRNQPADNACGDMYWLLIEFRKLDCRKSPFEDPRPPVCVRLDNAIEIPYQSPGKEAEVEYKHCAV